MSFSKMDRSISLTLWSTNGMTRECNQLRYFLLEDQEDVMLLTEIRLVNNTKLLTAKGTWVGLEAI